VISPQRHRGAEKFKKFGLFFLGVSVTRGERKLAAVADVHHVAVLDDVVLAFEAQRAFGAGVGFGAGFEELIPAAR